MNIRPFVVEMIEYMRTHFPEELRPMPKWELGETLEDCFARASGYGLIRRRDYARFGALAVCLGWSFDIEMQWPAEVLSDRSTSPSERMARVYERCIDGLEQGAKTAAIERKLGV